MPKKQVIIISIIAFLIMCTLACIAIFSHEKGYEPANSIDDLLVGVKYGSSTETIRIWSEEQEDDTQAEECIYYFFLPSMSKDRKVTFLNLPLGEVLFDNNKISNKANLMEIEDLFERTHAISFSDGQSANVVFLKSSHIGALYIETESGGLDVIKADKNNREKASVAAFDENGNAAYNGEIEYIKCRGTSSFLYCDKKSFTVKFPKKVSLLNMGKSDKWELLANYYDDSRIKNKLAYDYIREYSAIPAAESEYIDLYINGSYEGNYLICEHPEDVVDMKGENDLESRNEAVNTKGAISTALPAADGNIKGYSGLSTPTDITGGYIIEAGATEETADCSFTTDLGIYYEVIYPQNATIEEVRYICNYMNEAEKSFVSPNGINPETGKHFSDYIDIQSWSQKYVIEELFSDTDKTVLNRSEFFYKFSDSVDSHIYAGPAWDFDVAFGENAWVNYDVYLDYPNSTCGKGMIYSDYLFDREEMRTEIEKYFTDIASVYVDDHASADIRSISDKIVPSLDMEAVRWPGTKGRYSTSEANWKYISWFLNARRDFLNDVWIDKELYHQVVFLDSNGGVCDRYMIKDGEPITRIPHVASYEGVFAGWRFGERDWLLVEGMPIFEDVTFRSTWYDAELLSLNLETISGTDLSGVDLDALKALVNAVEEAQKRGENE